MKTQYKNLDDNQVKALSAFASPADIQDISDAGGIYHVLTNKAAASHVQDLLDDITFKRFYAILNEFANNPEVYGCPKIDKAKNGHTGVVSPKGLALRYGFSHVGCGNVYRMHFYIGDLPFNDAWDFTVEQVALVLSVLMKAADNKQ